MTVSSITIDLPLALTIAGVLISLVGLVVTVVLHRRQIRAAIARVDLNDYGLTIESPGLSFSIDATPQDHEDSWFLAALDHEHDDDTYLLQQLDLILHGHTQLGTETMAGLRAPSALP